MKYVDRCWNGIKLEETSQEDLVVFLLMKTLKELKNGSAEALHDSINLHSSLCDQDSHLSSGKTFSALFEEQDSHDLMFYLLDKLTTLTAKYAR